MPSWPGQAQPGEVHEAGALGHSHCLGLGNTFLVRLFICIFLLIFKVVYFNNLIYPGVPKVIYWWLKHMSLLLG